MSEQKSMTRPIMARTSKGQTIHIYCAGADLAFVPFVAPSARLW